MKSTAGLILAGGLSTRMRQDKALMLINGETLINRQWRILSEILGVKNVFVSGRRPGFQCVEDQDSGLGPVEGLRSTCDYLIQNTVYKSLLLLPVDMPYLDNETLRLLSESADQDVDLIRYENYQLPVFFNDVRKLYSKIESLKLHCTKSLKNDEMGNKKYSFKELFKTFDTTEIKVENQFQFQNINTPEDFFAAISKANIAFADR